ncbi:MAG TPA: extracellular solute-binding protein [Polyangiaceae bacterium]|nr:extracellular solute-binding protein [Polyangiaceae bacterium]
MLPASPRLLVLLVFLAAWMGSGRMAKAADGERVRVLYWEKWRGFEKDAMQAVVDDYNRAQDRIFVEYVAVSDIRTKTLIATAGGDPPDIAGLADEMIDDFADKNALLPLETFTSGTAIVAERYLPVYWDMVHYRGHLWALPTAPVIGALHWNKDLFREAGLDPEKPPRSIAELDEFSKKLTRRNKSTGQLEIMGFLHSEPGHWPQIWGYFFGGELWDGSDRITFDSPANIRAYEWVQSYARDYGPAELQTLRSSFGPVSSAQNAFLSGKVAMALQGIWMANFIATYNPKMHWGAAPFPSAVEGSEPIALANADVLVIPRGARHPREAFSFLAYMAEQKPLEKLCLGQSKNSPLADVSPEFFAHHKNPYIRMFQDLAKSPKTVHFPNMSVWQQYRFEAYNAFERIWLLQATPAQALRDATERAQRAWDRERERRNRVDETPPSPWIGRAPVLLIAAIAAIVFALARREHTRTKALTAGKPARANASLVKGLLFVSPWIGGLVVFVLYPITSSVVLSFCDYSVLSEARFVGLLNYHDLLGDELFWTALKNTAYYACLALPLGLSTAFFWALILSSNVRGAGIYRTFIFLPSLTPLVASAMVWLWIYNAQYGVLNHLLSFVTFGLVHHVPWLKEARYAMPSLIFMSLWSVGHTVVIMMAAMQEVPTALYEAADIDGATLWQKVRHITVPMITPVLYFNTILGIIQVVQVFATPFIMTKGGPTRSTYFYSMYLYENAFVFLRMGYACAMAWILFLVILALTGLAMRFARSEA